jgi:hypothetical protein
VHAAAEVSLIICLRPIRVRLHGRVPLLRAKTPAVIFSPQLLDNDVVNDLSLCVLCALDVYNLVRIRKAAFTKRSGDDKKASVAA